jgi:hypothetical protein
MNRQKTLIAAVFLLLTGATAGILLYVSTHQKLGSPGVLTRSLPGTRNLQVVLPGQVPGFACQIITTQAEEVVQALPDDTSFGTCRYTAQDGFQSLANVVLMGTDRSSIHKPQVCLTAQGWEIDESSSKVEKIGMQKPFPYDLPVMRLTATQRIEAGGETKTRRGVYVYWYVDGGKITALNSQIMWWMARDMFLTGVLDRFSYIAYFSVCEPGQEEHTFDRMKALIAGSVPQFQLVPHATRGVTASGP